MRLLYYSPTSYGGLADYAHEQANALTDLGIEVTFLCTPDFPQGRQERYKIVPVLQELNPQNPSTQKIIKAIAYTHLTISNVQKLTQFIKRHSFKSVLLGSYSEYLAPLWSGPLQRLAQQGVAFGAIVHDPVRDFVLGPPWWHRWSIACGYSFLQEAFVHEAIDLDTAQPMPRLRTTVIPHGVYPFPPPTQTRSAVRASLNLPAEAQVMLSFGHIRDGKNLDLVIRAMAQFPDLYLVVAGKEQSSGQRPASFYQDLAAQLGVAERCRWQIRFILDTEVGNFFEAADLILLTYSAAFRSASGVLNTAVNYQKPCLASSGESTLRSVVEKHGLGIWIAPDSVETIVNGIQGWLVHPSMPQWDQYLEDNAWRLNAKTVMQRLGGS